jgi:PCI domain
VTQANTLVLAIGGSVDHARGINDDLRNARSRFDFKSIASHAQRVTMACSLVFHAMATFYCSADKDFKFDTLFDMFLDEKFLGAIQLGAPVLLRYLVLLYMFAYERKSLKVDHNTLVDIIRNEVCEYKDVFVQFVTTLYIDFDLVAVGDQIQAVSQEVSKDIIFSQHASVVVENCKKMYFEVYCKMYNSVDLTTVATFLGIDKESAEIWIVNLLRKNNISARMSDAGDCIYIGGKANNENENLNKRAKELMSRNKIMLNNAAKFLS